jgi:L-2,4-diaminobutyrate decarboxylase
VLFKEGHRSYEAFSQEATYLFAKSAREEWYNFAHRTMECTKKMMGLKMYVCLQALGSGYFSQYVERMYDLTREFAQLIEQSPDFQLALPPQSNIICFRYCKQGYSGRQLDALQSLIRQKVLEQESYYIVQTDLGKERYLRCTIINPLTTLDHLRGLLELIRDLI